MAGPLEATLLLRKNKSELSPSKRTVSGARGILISFWKWDTDTFHPYHIPSRTFARTCISFFKVLQCPTFAWNHRFSENFYLKASKSRKSSVLRPKIWSNFSSKSLKMDNKISSLRPQIWQQSVLYAPIFGHHHSRFTGFILFPVFVMDSDLHTSDFIGKSQFERYNEDLYWFKYYIQTRHDDNHHQLAKNQKQYSSHVPAIEFIG